MALQVVKRKGFNLIDTADLVQGRGGAAEANWPPELQAAVQVGTSNDQSRIVDSMVEQLEGSVLTAIALVMIVVLAALGYAPPCWWDLRSRPRSFCALSFWRSWASPFRTS